MPPYKETENDILEKALEAIEREAGLRLTIDQVEAKYEGRIIDAILRLDGGNYRFAAEVKRWVPQTNAGALLHQLGTLPFTGILVADYINPKMADRLRHENIQFIDTAGNAYINAKPVYVFVSGKRRPQENTFTKEGANRAFDRTGLKVVFAFLNDPSLVNTTYREIAGIADVALGTVGWVINGLKRAGLLLEKRKTKERHLVDYQRLLDRWVETYPEKLKPKQLIGNFLAEDPDWWKSIDIRSFEGVWGGETAAALYTSFLKPETGTVYLPKGMANQFLAQARLRKAPELQQAEPGSVRVYNMFWHEKAAFLDIQQKRGLAPPVLVYADLVATGDPRNRETAKMIYDEYLAKYCREG